MLDSAFAKLAGVRRFTMNGKTSRVVGLAIEATGLENVAVGELCKITSLNTEQAVFAEVVGFHERGALLMPLGGLDGVHPGSIVEPWGKSDGIGVGPGLLGRVIDGLGQPIDGKGAVAGPTVRVPLTRAPPNPLHRRTIDRALSTGVRAIDGMLTMGEGQRVGIFAGSGVGKSTLLGMIARRSSADINVIALLGERGREVKDFLEGALGEKGLERSIVIVATGDQAALLRARGALVATAIAEHFRDLGKHVLLMVDSITRVAMAWREIGLAAGEPPTTRGYPPSVFANLPRLLERAGSSSKGSISGVYTVLVEGDDMLDPIADTARSILDGHFVLSRSLADAGHYPAIDVLESRSRVRDQLISAEHRMAIGRVTRGLAAFREKEDLVAVGAYRAGTDPDLDAFLHHRASVESFLRQPPDEKEDVVSSGKKLLELAEQLSTPVEESAA